MIFAKYNKLMLIQITLAMIMFLIIVCCQSSFIDICIVFIHYKIISAGISAPSVSVCRLKLNECCIVTASVNGILSGKILCHVFCFYTKFITVIHFYFILRDVTVVY